MRLSVFEAYMERGPGHSHEGGFVLHVHCPMIRCPPMAETGALAVQHGSSGGPSACGGSTGCPLSSPDLPRPPQVSQAHPTWTCTDTTPCSDTARLLAPCLSPQSCKSEDQLVSACVSYRCIGVVRVVRRVPCAPPAATSATPPATPHPFSSQLCIPTFRTPQYSGEVFAPAAAVGRDSSIVCLVPVPRCSRPHPHAAPSHTTCTTWRARGEGRTGHGRVVRITTHEVRRRLLV